MVSYLFNNIEILRNIEFVEPSPIKGNTGEEHVIFCVKEKLSQLLEWNINRAFLNNESARIQPSDLVLVADTTVAVAQNVLEKPIDKKDSRRMLKMLSGQEHQVYTAYSLGFFKDIKTTVIHVSKSTVVFKRLSPKIIEKYVRTGEGLDKAGAYGFQGRGLQLISQVKGSYTNIMGLPLEDLRARAEALGLE